MASKEIEALRAIVADEALTITERRDAAEHAVRLIVASVPDVLNTDVDVAVLLNPWPRETQQQRWLADSWADVSKGRSLHGYTVPDAKAAVLKRRVRLLLESLTADQDEHLYVRQAAQSALQTR